MHSSTISDEIRRRGRRTALHTWGIYLLVLTAWVAVVAIFTLLGIIVCASVDWSGGILYSFLRVVSDYLPFFVIAAVLVGWAVISYLYIGRAARDLELLLSSAEALAHPTEDPIRLPVGLKSAEDQLNLVREQAIHNVQAAREAEQRKNDLVVYLAHDLKTPLTSVIGYLTLLRDEPQISPEVRARYTAVALDKAERLEDLINEFFDITRFNLATLELKEEPVNMTRMLEQITFEFQPVLKEKDMSWDLHLMPEVQVTCDADKMERVFDNLFRNAVNYGYPGSQITVVLRRESDSTVVQVRNRGRTIPPEKLSKLFEQFFRLDSARSTFTGGAGLGLAIAKEIVEHHGGSITAESADEQILFTVTLPDSRKKIVRFA